jgi:hypothetical protein
LKNILHLIAKDLLRDWKHPWSILLFASLPLLMTLLISSVFGGRGGTVNMPVIHLAVMDQDDDFLSRALRSMSGQGDGKQQIQVHYTETRAEGIRLIERDAVSAFIVFPKHMTEDLLAGKTNAMELYENPAQQILPRIARQGALLMAAGLSGAGELLGEPLREVRAMFQMKEFPADAAVGSMAQRSAEKLRGLETYLFPPLITFTNIPASDWRPE